MCVCLSELLLGVSPHSGSLLILSHTCTHTHSHTQSVMCMCAPGRAVARSFSTFRVFVCVCLGELLLGVSPHSGMCAPGRAVARSFSTFRLFVCVCLCELLSFSTFRLFVHVCVCLCELLLGVSPCSGMCAPGRAVARSFSTFRLFVCVCLGELVLGVSPRSTLRLFCMTVLVFTLI